MISMDGDKTVDFEREEEGVALVREGRARKGSESSEEIGREWGRIELTETSGGEEVEESFAAAGGTVVLAVGDGQCEAVDVAGAALLFLGEDLELGLGR